MSAPFKVRALFEYKSDYADDLTFAPGQLITVTEIEDDEWYSGTYEGKLGMFPKNFVEIVKEEASPEVPARKSAPESVAVPTVDAKSVNEPESDQANVVSTPTRSVQADDFESEKPEPVQKTEKLASAANISSSNNAAKVPMPGMPMPGNKNLQRNDPYAVKRQFFGAGKSSYVPQVNPRDQSNIISHAYRDVAKNTEVVRENDRNDKEEDKEPKMSLKERIAMLQQRQKEEAEREAAALKRREERKKDKRELQRSTTGNSLIHTAELASDEEDTSHVVDGENVSPEVARTHTSIPEDRAVLALDGEAKEEHKDEGVAEEEVEANEVEEQDDEGDEDEEDEEDEDLKRRRLVERMAKISGGRNMFGMMGMPTPFGASQKIERKKSESKPRTKAPAKAESKLQTQEVPVPAPIPIPGMSHTGEVPDVLRRRSIHETQDKKAEEAAESPADDPGSVEATKEEALNSSDLPDEDNIVLDHTSNNYAVVDSHPRSPPLKLSESEAEENQEIDLAIGQAGNDGEVTGYDADEDVSDRGAGPDFETETITEAHFANTSTRVPALAKPPAPPSHVPPVVTPLAPTTGPSSEAAAPPAPVVELARPPMQKEPNVRALPPRCPPPIPTGNVDPPAISAPPPVPSTSFPSDNPPIPPTAPPVPSAVTANPHAEYLDSSDENEEFQEVPEDSLDTELDNISEDNIFKRPQKAHTFSHPPPVPAQLPNVPSRVATSSSIGRASFDSTRKSSELSRNRSLKDNKGEKVQAETFLGALQSELDNLAESSGWWLKNEIPDSLHSKLGSDLIFEVDSNKITKRGDKVVIYKDYYILFYDLSQIVMELLYDSDDPRSSGKVIDVSVVGSSGNRKDILHHYNATYGNDVVAIALRLVGSKVPTGLVLNVFGNLRQKFQNLLTPIGEKSFGVTIYRNFNHNVVKYDDIRPGDILCMKNAKFTSHKGLGSLGNKSVTVGDGNEVYSAVIAEYDSKKEKLRVLETDRSGVVKRESYKIGDMKSGRIRVFRFVDRAFVGW